MDVPGQMVDDKQVQPTGAEQRLHDHNIQLPPVPTPLGAYVEVVQTGNLLFLSGMLPVAGGKPAYLGRLGVELTVEDGRSHRLSERAVGDTPPLRLTRQGEPRGQAWRVDRHGWGFPGTSERCRCGFENVGTRFRGRENIDPDRARRCKCATRDANRVGSYF